MLLGFCCVNPENTVIKIPSVTLILLFLHVLAIMYNGQRSSRLSAVHSCLQFVNC